MDAYGNNSLSGHNYHRISLIMEWQFTKSIHSSFMHIAINIPGIQLVWSQLPPDVSFLNTIHTQTVLIIFSMTARAASKV